jgi:hypothetical protein
LVMAKADPITCAPSMPRKITFWTYLAGNRSSVLPLAPFSSP